MKKDKKLKKDFDTARELCNKILGLAKEGGELLKQVSKSLSDQNKKLKKILKHLDNKKS